MSDQSPWGQAPPPNPHVPPSGGSYPGGAYPGGPPPSGYPGPGYGAPQGPKRNTGLIIGIVAAVVLLIAGVTTTVVLLAGGNGDDTAKNDPTSGSTSESPTESDSPTPAPASDVLQGDGYSYDLPGPGWKDASEEAASTGLGPTIDTVAILGSSLDLAQSNILVEALPNGGATSVEQLQPQWERNLSGTDGVVPVPIDETTIDGERAVGVKIIDRKNTSGALITQIAYLTIHGDSQFSIALSFPSDGDVVSEDDFHEALDSWTWTS